MRRAVRSRIVANCAVVKNCPCRMNKLSRDFFACGKYSIMPIDRNLKWPNCPGGRRRPGSPPDVRQSRRIRPGRAGRSTRGSDAIHRATHAGRPRRPDTNGKAARPGQPAAQTPLGLHPPDRPRGPGPNGRTAHPSQPQLKRQHSDHTPADPTSQTPSRTGLPICRSGAGGWAVDAGRAARQAPSAEPLVCRPARAAARAGTRRPPRPVRRRAGPRDRKSVV